jgi:hypothetical protein
MHAYPDTAITTLPRRFFSLLSHEPLQIVCVVLLMSLIRLPMQHTKGGFNRFDIIAKDGWPIPVPYQIKIGNMLLLHSSTRIQFQARVWTTLNRLSP